MSSPISNPPTARARLTDLSAQPSGSANTSRTNTGKPVTATAMATSVDLSPSITKSIGSDLATEGPPLDLRTVARIKEAIAEGRYPIDAGAITERLFEGLDESTI